MKLNLTESRTFTIEVDIQNLDINSLVGFLRLRINNIEYGFPCNITESEITSEILPLSEIVKNHKFFDGEKIEAKLEVFHINKESNEGYYIKPWEGQFTINSGLKIEAKAAKLVPKENRIIKIEQDETPKEIEKPDFSDIKNTVKNALDDMSDLNEDLPEEDYGVKKGKKELLIDDEDDKKEEDYGVKKGEKELLIDGEEDELHNEIKETVNLLKRKEEKERKLQEKKQKKERMKIARYIMETYRKEIILISSKAKNKQERKKIINKFIDEKISNMKKLPVTESKSINKKRDITEEDVYNLMKSLGTSNKRVQNVLLEKAKSESKTDEWADVYDKIYEYLTKKNYVKVDQSSLLYLANRKELENKKK